MNKYHLSVIFAATLALAACTNDNEPTAPDNGPVAAQVNASIEGTTTRASGTEWAAGDQIGIFSVSSGLTQYKNYPYQYDGSEFSYTDDAIYYQDAQEVTFSAYYPFYGTTGTMLASIPATTTANEQTAENQPKIDFLFAKGAIGSKANPTVNFTGNNAFHHCMSQITLTFIEGSDMNFPGSLSGYKLKGLKLSGEFNPLDGTTETKDEVTDLDIELSDVRTENVDNKNQYTASPVILFPQDMNRTIGIEVTVDGETYSATLTIPENKEALEAGNNYTWPVTVSKTGMTVGQADIKDWTPVKGEGTTAWM